MSPFRARAMRKKVVGLSLMALVVACATSFVQAQQSEDSSQEKSSISSRLDRLRKGIFGSSDDSDSQVANRTRTENPNRASRAGSAAHRASRSRSRTSRSSQTARTQSTDAAPRTRTASRLSDSDRASVPVVDLGDNVPAPRATTASTRSSSSAPSARSTSRSSSSRDNSARRLVPQTEAASPYGAGRTAPRTANRSRSTSQSRRTAPAKSTARSTQPKPQIVRPTSPSPRTQAATERRTSPRAATTTSRGRVAGAPVRDRVAVAPARARAAETPIDPPTPVAEVDEPAPVATRPARKPAKADLPRTTRTAGPRRETAAAEPTKATAKGSVSTSRLTSGVEPDAVLFAQRSPLLRVETLGPMRIVVGKEAVYKLRIQNLGDVGAEGVIVQMQLPSGADVVSSTPTTGDAREVDGESGMPSLLRWEMDLVKGRTHEELIVKLIPRDSSEFELAVNWQSAPAKSQTIVEVQEPKLQLDLDGPSEFVYGDSKIYRMTVSNPGTGDAENVSIQLMPIDGGSQPASQHKLGTILAGDDRVLEIELTARQAGELKIHALASGDGDLRAEISEKVLVRRADIEVAVVGPPMKYAGTMGIYQVQVANSGDATAEDVQVVAALPAGVKHVKPLGRAEYDEAAGQVTWSVGSLRAGQSRQMQVHYMVNSGGSNTLKVAASTKDNLSASGEVTTQVEATADLKLDVSDPAGPVAVGEEMVYIVRVRNRGSKEAKNVELFGFFSEGLEPTKIREGRGEMSPGQVIFEPIAELRAGGEKVFKIIAKAERGGNHVFHAEMRCKPLDTRLVAEESTLFYETQAAVPFKKSAAQPQPAKKAPTFRAPPSAKRAATKTDAAFVKPSAAATESGERAAAKPTKPAPPAYTPPNVTPAESEATEAAAPAAVKPSAEAKTRTASRSVLVQDGGTVR